MKNKWLQSAEKSCWVEIILFIAPVPQPQVTKVDLGPYIVGVSYFRPVNVKPKRGMMGVMIPPPPEKITLHIDVGSGEASNPSDAALKKIYSILYVPSSMGHPPTICKLKAPYCDEQKAILTKLKFDGPRAELLWEIKK